MYKNRGMLLESIINKTFKEYDLRGIAVFHKKNIPISFSKIIKNEDGKHKIQDGWVDSKSTADYYGVYKGIFVAIEAKSIKGDKFPIQNIKEHQKRYIEKINDHGGIGFFIIYFSSYNRFFAIRDSNLFLKEKKHITINECEKFYNEIELIYPGCLNLSIIIEKFI